MSVSRRSFLNAAALALAPAALTPRHLSGWVPTNPSSLGSLPTDTPRLPEPPREAARRGKRAPGDPSPSATRDALTSTGPPPSGRYDAWVEVLPSHLQHNVEVVRRLAGGRPILAVVKNNAYGLDIGLLGRVLDGHPAIWGFAVVKGEEALALRTAGVTKPILLMGLFAEEEGRELAEADVRFSAFTPDAAERLLPLARAVGRPLAIHVYLDTGMGRMGMSFREAVPWITDLAAHPELRIEGTFTELSEEGDFDRVQVARLKEVVETAQQRGIAMGMLHAAASNGVFHVPEAHLDMVRPGIALFGSYPSDPASERARAELRPAVRVRARVVRVSHLQAGDGVGYGRPWIAEHPTWVATLPVGHADGYPREAALRARVLIGDRLFPVIGAVSASHSVVEVGAEPIVRVGDLVTFMGPDRSDTEPNVLASALEVSVYDLLMHLNPTLPRFEVEA